MKRFIVFSLALISIIVVLDFAFGKGMDYMRSHAKGGHTRKMEAVASSGQQDILIMGSSRACHHYDSRIISQKTGQITFNTGYEGNGIILMYGLLMLNLQHNTPKTILYDITPEFDFYVHEDDANLRYLAFLKPYRKQPKIRDLIRDVSPVEGVKLVSSFYRYNSYCLTVANDFFRGKEDSFGGYLPMHGKLSSLPQEQSAGDKRIVDPLKKKYLQALIDVAKKHGIRLFFVASPKAGNGDASVFSPIKALCASQGIPFLDHLEDTGFITNPDLFNDPAHLNAEGASLFSFIIADEIHQAQ